MSLSSPNPNEPDNIHHLADLTVKQLRALAQAQGVKLLSRYRKAEIISVMQSHWAQTSSSTNASEPRDSEENHSSSQPTSFDQLTSDAPHHTSSSLTTNQSTNDNRPRRTRARIANSTTL